MPANSILEVYAVTPAVENAVVSVLSAANLAAYSARSREDVPADFVGVRAEVIGQQGHMQNVNGSWRVDDWSLSLMVEVQTQRPQEAAANTNGLVGRHAEWVSSVAHQLSHPVQALSNTHLLPHHEVLRIDLSSITTSVDESGAFDVTSMQYDVIIAARPEAWPTE